MGIISKTRDFLKGLWGNGYQQKSLNQAFFDEGGNYPSGLVDELIEVLDEYLTLTNEPNPRRWIAYSSLMYRIFPPYKKAINERQKAIGTVLIENITDNKEAVIDDIIAKINEIPIYEKNTLTPIHYGINALLNTISKYCDRYGMGFCQLMRDEKGRCLGIKIFNPPDFFFGFNAKGEKNLYYGNDLLVDITQIYLFKYDSEAGFDWGVPLIYGNKVMSDIIMGMLAAIPKGVKRNMNPFDITIASTDVKQLMELSEEQQLSIKKGIERLREDIKLSATKSLKGESVHLFANIPALSSISNIKAASTVNIIDTKTLQTYLELSTLGFGVPYQLIMDTGGSMNTDKYTVAILEMEQWATEHGRTQLLPIFKRLIIDIFISHKQIVTDKEVKISLNSSQTVLAFLMSKAKNKEEDKTQE